jgi:hypothetical protein
LMVPRSVRSILKLCKSWCFASIGIRVNTEDLLV